MPDGYIEDMSTAALTVVRPGEGWFAIARRLGVTVDALLAANAANTKDALHPGRVLAYVQPANEPTPDPDPPPSTDRVWETYCLRVPHFLVPNAAAYIEELKRVPRFFRYVIDHTDGEGKPMFSDATGSAHGYWVGKHDTLGLANRYPTMATSTIFPGITEPPGNLSPANRAARHRAVLAGLWDHKIGAILDHVAQGPPHAHRFCLNSEAELSSYAYSKHGIDPVLWREAFAYVAQKIHERGHLVVYAGNGPFLRQAPTGVPWWEHAMPSLDSFDVFGCDVFISADVGPDMRLAQIDEVAEIARDHGKLVAYPEYGVRQGVYTDAEAIAYLRAAWDRMADMEHLDHHCPWNDNDARQTAGMRAAVVDRFGV